MQVFIKTLMGKTITLEVDRSDTVERVIQKIREHEGDPRIDGRLIYGDKQLTEGRTLSDYDIGKEASIHFIMRPNPASSEESKPPESVVPAEASFLTDEEAYQTVRKWQELAEKGDFDADTHIVAPEAHFAALQKSWSTNAHTIQRDSTRSSSGHRGRALEE